MTIPIVFQAKAMATRLLITTAFALAVLFAAILLVSFDDTNDVRFSDVEILLKNESSLLNNGIGASAVVLPLSGGAAGPESFAFDGSGGGPYTGISDGRILRWQSNESRWVDFAVTSPERDGCEGAHDHSETEPNCGRPLGLRFNEKTGDLYIADAYMGLLLVGPNGGLASPLGKEVNGLALGFANSLDIDPNNGVVYFTDSSRRFSRRNHISIIITGDDSGRLMKFDLKTKKASILVDNLKFPNGVALSKNGDYLLFVETTTCRLLRLWLKTSKAGMLEVIVQLPGFPDNIKRNGKGEFWVGINSRRGKFLNLIISNPWIGNIVVRMVNVTKMYSCVAQLIGGTGMGIKVSEEGNVVDVLGMRWREVSEVYEDNGNLWIGSVTLNYIVKHKFF